MTKKRFVQLDDGLDFIIKDNLTKKFLSDDGSLEKEMNKLWNKVLRFEKYNSELAQRCIEYEDKISELTIQLKICNEHKLFSRRELEKENKELKAENEQLKQQVEDLEFELRTIKAFDKTVKEEHSDTVYDFKKKLEKW